MYIKGRYKVGAYLYKQTLKNKKIGRNSACRNNNNVVYVYYLSWFILI